MRPAPRFEIVPPGVRLADAYGPPLDGMAEGDLLALWLRRRGAARDARLAAGRLLERFGGLAAIVAADAPELARTPGVDAAFVADLKVLRELCVRLVRSEVGERPRISSWTALLAYVRVALAHEPREQFRALFLDKRNALLRDEFVAHGAHNTILDNCHVYTAFSALDPLTQDKVSKLTGSVSEIRTSRSAPSGLAPGRGSVSRSEVERPLMEPGEIRALPDAEQLVFIAGQRPLRTQKLCYDRQKPFRSRAGAPPPDQAVRVDAPGRTPHPWLGRRSLGRDAGANLPLFKEVAGAMDDRKAAARAADLYGRVAQEMAAQQAVLDQLQGGKDG